MPWCLKSLATGLFVQQLINSNNKETMTALFGIYIFMLPRIHEDSKKLAKFGTLVSQFIPICIKALHYWPFVLGIHWYIVPASYCYGGCSPPLPAQITNFILSPSKLCITGPLCWESTGLYSLHPTVMEVVPHHSKHRSLISSYLHQNICITGPLCWESTGIYSLHPTVMEVVPHHSLDRSHSTTLVFLIPGLLPN